MPRRHVAVFAVSATLLLFAALSHAQTTDGQSAETVADASSVWRQLFKRPQAPPAPPDNPLTPEKIALGARLFADKRLSGAGGHACSGCHEPSRSFTDGHRQARALTGAPLRRNTPALWNLAWSKQFFWDGRAPSLEAQVRMPIEAADEMGGTWPVIVQRLGTDADLTAQFRAAFPDDPAISEDTVVKALASYVRSLVSPPTRFDAWIEGNTAALDASEMRGFELFTGKAGCMLCHFGWRFTDDRFHDIGLKGKDPGRAAIPEGTPGRMAFKTPSLRDVAHTAPYMHDGSLPTLTALLKHYSDGFVSRPTLAPHMNRKLRLTFQEKADLVAFLRTLSHDKAAPRVKQGAASH